MTKPFYPDEHLSAKWQSRLKDHIRILSGGEYETPGARHFTETIYLKFPDDSEAKFHWAFYLKDEAAGELAVFTEHCGYHIFPLMETQIDVQQRC
jgi:hypothetical protein